MLQTWTWLSLRIFNYITQFEAETSLLKSSILFTQNSSLLQVAGNDDFDNCPAWYRPPNLSFHFLLRASQTRHHVLSQHGRHSRQAATTQNPRNTHKQLAAYKKMPSRSSNYLPQPSAKMLSRLDHRYLPPTPAFTFLARGDTAS